MFGRSVSVAAAVGADPMSQQVFVVVDVVWRSRPAFVVAAVVVAVEPGLV